MQRWLSPLFEYRSFGGICHLIVNEERSHYNALQTALSSLESPRTRLTRAVDEEATRRVNGHFQRCSGGEFLESTSSRRYRRRFELERERVRSEREREERRELTRRAREKIRLKRIEAEANANASADASQVGDVDSIAPAHTSTSELLQPPPSTTSLPQHSDTETCSSFTSHMPSSAGSTSTSISTTTPIPNAAKFHSELLATPVSIPTLKLPPQPADRVIIPRVQATPNAVWSTTFEDLLTTALTSPSPSASGSLFPPPLLETSTLSHLQPSLYQSTSTSLTPSSARLQSIYSARTRMQPNSICQQRLNLPSLAFSPSSVSLADTGVVSNSPIQGTPQQSLHLHDLNDDGDDDNNVSVTGGDSQLIDDNIGDDGADRACPPDSSPYLIPRDDPFIGYPLDPSLHLDPGLEHIHALHQLDSPPSNIFKTDTLIRIASGEQPIAVTYRASSLGRVLPSTSHQRALTHRAMTPKSNRTLETFYPTPPTGVISQTERSRALAQGIATATLTNALTSLGTMASSRRDVGSSPHLSRRMTPATSPMSSSPSSPSARKREKS